MKIRELLEAPTPITPAPIPRDEAEKIFKSKGKELGRGCFGKAYEIPKDVSTVVKVSSLNLNKWDQDGYYNYIEAIKDIKDETHNPYLPQIYEIRRMESKNGQDKWLAVNIEKLHSIESLSREQVLLVLQNLIGRKLTAKEIKGYEGEDDYVLYNEISRILEDYIRYSKETKYSPYSIKNPQLLQALKIIKQLNGRGFSIDIHNENYMFRLTPYGPQLVLTDPLSFRLDRVRIFTKAKAKK